MGQIVIIGNGIAGVTTARHIRKRNASAEITIISSESEHFYSRTALMYIYMGHMRYSHTKPYEDHFWKKNRLELVYDHVENIDFSKQSLRLRKGEPLNYDKLVIATGSTPRTFGWPGENLHGVQGLYSLQDLESMEKQSKNLQHAVVVGGGLIGVEMAEMFHSRHIPVSFLVREKHFMNHVLPQQEAEMVNRHIEEQGIDLRLETELESIEDKGDGTVEAVVTKKGDTISCGFVGLTIGVQPNIDFLRDSALSLDKGILVNEYHETNIDNVYAVGDCAQFKESLPGRKPIEPIWYTGKIQGENCAKIICGDRKAYNPGMFFNSAKFFDIEYQVYGQVEVPEPEGVASVYWEHPNGRQSIRVVYHQESRAVLGFNLMGVRYRHEVCEKWIRKQVPVEKVMKQLKKANFDPEFHRKYEKAVMSAFKQQNQ